jgi:hypothetical protein
MTYVAAKTIKLKSRLSPTANLANDRLRARRGPHTEVGVTRERAD